MVTKRRGDGTSVTVTLSGVDPDRLYTAHVHTRSCSVDPNEFGPHYQNRKDEHRPSVDPAFAQPCQ
jgi:Cu-Zn family superoxide dismutase